ncbi:MAG: response regulator [Chloroflexia bacterium]
MAYGPVLVVDDEPETVAFLLELLEAEGYRVVTAKDGFDGLGVLLMEEPRVVVLDLDMPIVDGVNFAKTAQSYGVTPSIVMITGYDEAPQWARLMGAKAYLKKPFDIPELLAVIQEAYN